MKWIVILAVLLIATAVVAGPPKWRPMDLGDDEVLVMVNGRLVIIVPMLEVPAPRQGPTLTGPPLGAPLPPPPPAPPKVRVGNEP